MPMLKGKYQNIHDYNIEFGINIVELKLLMKHKVNTSLSLKRNITRLIKKLLHNEVAF